jgi:hypothetical protein
MASMIRLSPRRDRPGIARHGVGGGEFVVVRGMDAPSPRRVNRLPCAGSQCARSLNAHPTNLSTSTEVTIYNHVE